MYSLAAVLLMMGLVVAATAGILMALVAVLLTRMRIDGNRAVEQLVAQGFVREGRSVVGQLADHPVTLHLSPGGAWQIEVTGLPRDLALRTSRGGTRQHRTGDRRIDSKWAIGSVEGGVGRLGTQARLVLDRIRPSVDTLVLSSGTLQATVADGSAVLDVVGNLERLAIELEGDPAHLLVNMIRSDPDPRVRGHMLWELAQVDRPRAIETVEKRDPHSAWGSEELLLMGELLGRTMFLERALMHPKTSARLAERIFGAWLGLDEDIAPALSAVAGRFGVDGIRRAAERIRGHAHHAAALIPWLPHVVLKSTDPGVPRAVVSIVRTLQEARVQAAVPSLIEVLDAVRGPAQLRVVAAIGALGDTDQVVVLRRLQDRLAITDFPTQRAIEEAVAEIQGRASGQAGAVSLVAAPPGAGLLSVVDAPYGVLAEAMAPLPEEQEEREEEALDAEAVPLEPLRRPQQAHER